MEQNELGKAAEDKVTQYFKYPFSSSYKQAVDIFKAGAEWQKVKDEAYLLRLVDLVWQTATESETVPSTAWAKRLIEQAKLTDK